MVKNLQFGEYIYAADGSNIYMYLRLCIDEQA